MPERRRPGLWKTLVAAAQTAIDRVADGVDVLADGVEALADGLRSIGRDGQGREKSPAPPTDPRLAGVDPALAAYVAAHDPVWFSFEAPGAPPLDDPGPVTEWDAASAPIRRDDPFSGDAGAHAEPTLPRVHPRRGVPSAAELPGGRLVRPERHARPRIAFRRRRSESVAEPPSHPAPSESAASPPWRVSASRAESGSARPVLDAEHADTATGRPVRASPSPDAVAPSPRSSTDGSRSIPPPHPSLSDARPAEPAAAVAFPVRSVPDAVSSTARPEPTATKRRAPFESVRQTSPPGHASSSAAGLIQSAPGRQDSRTPASPGSTGAARSTTSAPTPAPWPELPPSGWSAPAADDGGALAWAGASATDVLVDEQRST